MDSGDIGTYLWVVVILVALVAFAVYRGKKERSKENK